MQTADQEYAQFKQQQQKLAIQLRDAKSYLDRLRLPGWVDTIDQLYKRILSDRFKVLVVGEFKRGKSTFINALLREEVLPAYAMPCTAVINEVKWGQEKSARLHFRHPLPEKLPDGLAEPIVRYIRSVGKGPVPPIDIPVQDLERYVVIPDPGRDQAESVAETPFERIELFWPLDLCKGGVEIIDSPGLNEHGIRTKVTVDYLGKVDAVLFVMSCAALASQSEMLFLDNVLRRSGHEDIFLICNRYDEVRERERAGLESFARKKLGDRTRFGPEGLFFISALRAVDGERDRSGLPEFEKRLAHFLVHDRGRVKLLQPARNLAQALHEALFQSIPEQRQMLQESLTSLQERYDQVRPRLAEAEKMRESVLNQIERHRSALRDEVRRETVLFLRELTPKLPAWAAEIEVQAAINPLAFWKVSQQAEEVVKETVQGLTAKIEEEQGRWQQEKLIPLLEKRLRDLGESLDKPLEDFLAKLATVRANLSGLTTDETPEETKVGALERVLAGAGGFFLGGVGSAMEGVTMGYQGMLRSLIPNLAAILLLILVGVSNPFMWIAALVGMGLVRGLIAGGKLTDKAKLKVAQGMADQLHKQAAELGDKVSEEMNHNLAPFAEAVNAGMEKEIANIREQVEAVLSAKRAGEAEVQDRCKSLSQWEKALQTIDKDLRGLIFELAGDRGSADVTG